MRKSQMQISVFHLLAVTLSIILVLYVAILQNKVKMETISSNTEAQHLQLIRRLFTSPDCLAYEDRVYDVIGNKIYSARSTKPFVVDMWKWHSWEHFNCVRDVVGLDQRPSQFRYYNITLYDLDEGAKYTQVSTLPSECDENTGVCYELSATKECDERFFFDMFPVRIMTQDGELHEGLVYIKSCMAGRLVLPSEMEV